MRQGKSLRLPFISIIRYSRIKDIQFTQILNKTILLLMMGSVFLLTGCSAGPQVNNNNDFQNNNAYQSTSNQNSGSNVGSLSVADTSTAEIIHPGDEIQIVVWGYPEFNTSTTVKEFGTVTVPLVGDVVAAGLTKDQFYKLLKERLSQYIKGNPKITVSHISMNKRVIVMGEVVKQDNYPVVSEESLVEVLAAAGGPAADADMEHVKIFRKGNYGNAVEVDLTNHFVRGNIKSIPYVRPGDIVYVPKQENFIRSISDYARDVILLFGFFRILY